MERTKILVIEDELALRDTLVSYLNLEGSFAIGISELTHADAFIESHQPDIIILDLNLGKDDGYEWLEKATIPIHTSVIVASARGEVIDRVKGFGLGIESYLTKPVAFEELTAIISNIQQKKASTTSFKEFQGWVLNRLEWSIKHTNHAEVIKLTKLEELIITKLAESPGMTVTKRNIIIAINKPEDTYDHRSLEALIRRLRQKLATISGDRAAPIKTVHAVGYAFIEPISIVPS